MSSSEVKILEKRLEEIREIIKKIRAGEDREGDYESGAI